jgi:hypothetical protein
MVRATVAFAVVALGAAAVIAQAPEGIYDLDARDYNDLEVRGFEDMVDMEAREPEFFDELEARQYEADPLEAREPEFFDELEARQYEADQLEARDFDVEELDARAAPPQAPLPAPPVLEAASPPAPTPVTGAKDVAPTPPPAGPSDPSKTVTITQTPTPTSCTKKDLKRQKQQVKVKKAIAVVSAAKGKKDLTAKEKAKVKKAKKYLRRVRHKRTKAAKRTAKKCKKALKKAGLKLKDCKAGADCTKPLAAAKVTPSKCLAAKKFLKHAKKSKHAKHAKHAKTSGDKSKTEKSPADKSKTHKHQGHKKYSDLLPSKTTKSVGPDGVTTVVVNAGPTCTPTGGSKSKLSKRFVARDIADEEFESVFAREYDYDNLD